MPDVSGEITKPKEGITSQEASAKKDTSISSQFEKTRGRLDTFTTGFRKSLATLTQEAPDIALDVEQQDFDRLSSKLTSLTQDTTAVIGLPSEQSGKTQQNLQGETIRNRGIGELSDGGANF